MRIPIDTVAVRFVTAGPAEPVLDYETRAPKSDESGQPLFSVHLFAVAAGSRDSITVKVAGEPKGLGEFTPVKVTNRWARTAATSMGEWRDPSVSRPTVSAPPREGDAGDGPPLGKVVRRHSARQRRSGAGSAGYAAMVPDTCARGVRTAHGGVD